MKQATFLSRVSTALRTMGADPHIDECEEMRLERLRWMIPAHAAKIIADARGVEVWESEQFTLPCLHDYSKAVEHV